MVPRVPWGRSKCPGRDATDLTSMVEKVTAGATGALGNISMSGFSSDNLSSMVEKLPQVLRKLWERSK